MTALTTIQLIFFSTNLFSLKSTNVRTGYPTNLVYGTLTTHTAAELSMVSVSFKSFLKTVLMSDFTKCHVTMSEFEGFTETL